MTTLSCLKCPLHCHTARNGWLCDFGIKIVEIPPAGELNGGSCITKGNMLALCCNGLTTKHNVLFVFPQTLADSSNWRMSYTDEPSLLL